MNDETPSSDSQSVRLLSPEEVREAFRKTEPEYGGGYDEADWRRITERLEALARLLWRFSCRTTSDTDGSSELSRADEGGSGQVSEIQEEQD
jgi:hypothetical protein